MTALRKALAHLLLLGTTIAFSSGCEWVALGLALDDDDECMDCCGDDGCWEDDWDDEECADGCCEGDPCLDCGFGCESEPPLVTVSIPEWPPVGPDGAVTVNASSETSTSLTAAFTFRNTVNKSFVGVQPGVTSSVDARGYELGEGLGTLTVTVTDGLGAWTEQKVDGLLVDLTPPSAYFDKTILPPNGELAFWIGDAWVVSGYSLFVGDFPGFEEILPAGYPSTFGTEWDYHYVSVPVDQFPLGTSYVTVYVYDAAGNETALSIPVTIDGLPPDVAISEPVEDAVLDGLFTLRATAVDDVPSPVSLEIYVGDALVATGVGPATSITMSSEDFPNGPATISIIGVDEAGNRSAPATRNVTFGGSAEPPPN